MRGLVLAVALGMTALASGGCTRSDDGSVTMADPLHVGRYLRPEPSPPATPPVRSGLQVFPISPTAQSAVQVRSSRSTALRNGKRRSSQAAPSLATEKPIACHDAMTSGGRVHVVCE